MALIRVRAGALSSPKSLSFLYVCETIRALLHSAN